MWLLDSSGDCRSRIWEMQNKEIKKDEFIRSLVMKGEYKPHSLNHSILRDEKSLAAMLQERIQERVYLYCKNV